MSSKKLTLPNQTARLKYRMGKKTEVDLLEDESKKFILRLFQKNISPEDIDHILHDAIHMAKIENAGTIDQLKVIKLVNPTVSDKEFWSLVRNGKTMEEIVNLLAPESSTSSEETSEKTEEDEPKEATEEDEPKEATAEPPEEEKPKKQQKPPQNLFLKPKPKEKPEEPKPEEKGEKKQKKPKSDK